MAKSSLLGISGRVGELVFYQMNGQTYVRSRPTKRKTKPTAPELKARKMFGLFAKYGTALIHRLRQQINYELEAEDFNRMRTWMRKQWVQHEHDANWLPGGSNTNSCEITSAPALHRLMYFEIGIETLPGGLIRIAIPSIVPWRQLEAHAHTMKVVLKVVALSSSFKGNPSKIGVASYEQTIPYNNNPTIEQQADLSIGAKPGDLVMVAVALRYIIATAGAETATMEKKWTPASIVTMGRI